MAITEKWNNLDLRAITSGLGTLDYFNQPGLQVLYGLVIADREGRDTRIHVGFKATNMLLPAARVVEQGDIFIWAGAQSGEAAMHICVNKRDGTLGAATPPDLLVIATVGSALATPYAGLNS